MSNSKLPIHDFYRSVSCAPVRHLSTKNCSELFKNHQVDLSCSIPSTIVIGDSIAAGLPRCRDAWYNVFLNATNLGIGGDPTELVIWRVDNLPFPASIKYVIIHFGTNNIQFNSVTDISNDILCVYLIIQYKLPNVTGVFPRSHKFSYFCQVAKDANVGQVVIFVIYTRYYF